MINNEDLKLLKRYCNPSPVNRLDRIAEDLGRTTKELKKRIRQLIRELVDYYEVKEGLKLKKI